MLTDKKIIFLGLFLLAGCGQVSHTNEQYTLEGVKLISEAHSDQTDPATFYQEVYTLSPGRRLLLAFEKLNQHWDKISVDEKQAMWIQVSHLGNASEKKLAEESLELCPMLRNWMMRATWWVASPLEKWTAAGGDFETYGCIKPSTPTKEQSFFSFSANNIHFMVNTWFQTHAKGRNQNYGFILLANREVKIGGESSASNSPKIFFKTTTITYPK